jgi:hypothetical protein
MKKPGRNADDGGPRQTLKVMAVFILALPALMALQFGATRAHQARWQIVGR